MVVRVRGGHRDDVLARGDVARRVFVPGRGDHRHPRADRGIERRAQAAHFEARKRAVDHVRPHARGVAHRLGHVGHVHQPERIANLRPPDAQRHEAHPPGGARHADGVVRERAHQPRDLRAVTRVVVGVVVLIPPVLERHHVGAARQADEVPAPDVVHEAVAVIVHARQTALLDPVRPDLARHSRHRPTQVRVIGDHPGVEDRDHDRAVAGADVPRPRRVDAVARRLVEPPRRAPQGIVRRGAHGEHADGLRALDLGQRPQPRERALEIRALRQVRDVEPREVGVRRAGRRRRLAAELGLEPRAQISGRRIQRGDAQARERDARGRHPDHPCARHRRGRQADLDAVRHVRGPGHRLAPQVAHGQVEGPRCRRGQQTEKQRDGDGRTQGHPDQASGRGPRRGWPRPRRASSLGSQPKRGQGACRADGGNPSSGDSSA